MQLRVKFTCFYEEEVRISLISEDNLFSVIKNKEINLFCGRQFNFHLVSYVKTFLQLRGINVNKILNIDILI